MIVYKGDTIKINRFNEGTISNIFFPTTVDFGDKAIFEIHNGLIISENAIACRTRMILTEKR